MNDPLASIEEKHGQKGIGALAVNVYEGALGEAPNRRVAFWATVAALIAAFEANQEERGISE